MVRRVAASLEHLLYSRDDEGTCPPQFATNGKNPCEVANSIIGPQCNQDVNTLLNAPTVNPSTICTCNTVVYNLASACAYCDGSNTTNAATRLLPFPAWTTNCSKSQREYKTYNGSNTLFGVPGWAYNNITSEGRFDVRAVLDGDDGWSAVQILVPVIVGLALLIAFAGFWLWRIRRRKRMRELPVPTGIAMSSWWCCARPRRVRRRRHVKGEWSVDADDEPDVFTPPAAPHTPKPDSPAPSTRSRPRVQRRLPRRVGTLLQHIQLSLGRPVAVLERKGSGRGEYDIDAEEDEMRAAIAMTMAMDKPLPQSPEPSAPRSNHTGAVSMGVLGLLSRLGLSTAASSSSGGGGGDGGGSYTGVNVEDEDDDRVEVDVRIASEAGNRRQGGAQESAEAGLSRLGPARSAASDGAESDNRATTGHNGQPPPSPSLFTRVAAAVSSRSAGPSRNRSMRSLADQGARPGLSDNVPPVPPLTTDMVDDDENRPIESAVSVADNSPATSYDPAPLPWAVRVNTSVPMLDGLGTGESGFLVPMDSPASGITRADNGSVVLISGTGRDFSLGPSSEGAGGASASACDSGSRSVRTNTTNTGTSGSNSRDRQSLAVYPPTPSDEARRFSNFGTPSARDSIPHVMLLPPALGGPPSAWVRGPNGRPVPRRARPRTVSNNSSVNASRSHSDEDFMELPPVPTIPAVSTSQSRSATTSSSLRVEPQTPQTATESSNSHSLPHASGSSVVGGLPTPWQSPVASPRGFDSPTGRADTDFSDVGENFTFASPLPSTITALFNSLSDGGNPQSRRQPPSQSLLLDDTSLASSSFSSAIPNLHSAPLSGRPSLPPISEAPISPLSEALPTGTTSLFTNTTQLHVPPNSSFLPPPVPSPSTLNSISHGSATGTTASKSRSSGTDVSAFTNGSSLLLAPPNTAAAPSPEVEATVTRPGQSTSDVSLLEPQWHSDVATYEPPSTKSHQVSLHRDPSPSSFSVQAQKQPNNESKTSLPQAPPLAKQPSHSPSSSISSLHSLQSPERPGPLGPRAHTHPGSISSKTSHGRAASASQSSLPRLPDSPAPSMHGRSISTSYLSPTTYPPASHNSPSMTARSPYTPSQLSVAGSSTSLYSPQAPSSALAYSPAQSSISLSSRPLPVPGQATNPNLPPGASPARIPGEGLGTRPLPPGPAISRVPSGSRGAHPGYGQFGQRYSTVAEEP
ncbi:unnamed protein product [Peniophora sp. CBMAI 1063]|nr:unnamed protein product [Peniophora sp. CBMAI 1063]